MNAVSQSNTSGASPAQRSFAWASSKLQFASIKQAYEHLLEREAHPMDRQPVSSSSLRSVGYDVADRILEVEFQDGGIYHYFDVPARVYRELMAAESKGSYFQASVKGRYAYRQGEWPLSSSA